jgi:hypothetical protein
MLALRPEFGEQKMKNISFANFTRFVGELIYGEDSEAMRAVIKPTSDGKAGLFYQGGALIQTYSRERDARRGATRMGLTVVE